MTFILVTISVDVFIFGHLDNATLWQTRFVIISTTLFASAIVQMVLAQSL